MTLLIYLLTYFQFTVYSRRAVYMRSDLVDGVGDLGREPVRVVVDLPDGGQLGRHGGRSLTEWSMNAGQQSLAESMARLISSINTHKSHLLISSRKCDDRLEPYHKLAVASTQVQGWGTKCRRGWMCGEGALPPPFPFVLWSRSGIFWRTLRR